MLQPPATRDRFELLATAYLQELLAGTSPTRGNVDAVRRELERRGVKGRPRAAADCPVARYLQSKLPEYGRITVGSSRCTAPGLGTVPLPHTLSVFTRAFDAGMFPGLIDR